MKREQGTAMRECMCASPTWTEQKLGDSAQTARFLENTGRRCEK